MRYQIIQIALLVPYGDDSAVNNIDDHQLDHPDQLTAWARLPQGTTPVMSKEQAAVEFQRLTGKEPKFWGEQ